MANFVFILMVAFLALFAIVLLFTLVEKIAEYIRRPKKENSNKKVKGKLYKVVDTYDSSKLPVYGQLNHSSRNPDLYYATRIQESLVCIVQNEKSIAAVCLLVMDSKIEYIIEDFPECCQKAGENQKLSSSAATISSQEIAYSHDLRGLLAIVDAFSTKWPLCDAVHILLENEELVRALNQRYSVLNKQKINPFEMRYDFKTFFQYTDNYAVEIINEQIWSDVIKVCRRLLRKQTSGGDMEKETKLWRTLNWHKQRIRLTEHNFHREPHAGKISPIPSSEQENSQSYDENVDLNEQALVQV